MRGKLKVLDKKLRRPSYAEVVATMALFIALGGVSYAAIKIPNNSVGTKQLKQNAVTSKKVKNRSLLAADFKAGQLPRGATGTIGAQGLAGEAGPKGPTGFAGQAGATGPAGATGEFGPTGNTGLTGNVGVTGEIGPTGPSTTAVSSGAGRNLTFGDEYFPVVGVGQAQPYPEAAATLSPSTTVTASDLSVKYDQPPFVGSRTILLMDDGNPVLACTVFGPVETTCSSSGSAQISPGSVLYMKTTTDLPNPADARFGFTLGP